MAFNFSMFDPTASGSPLGGLVRQGLTALPGGETALATVDAYNANRRQTTTRTETTDRGGGSPSPLRGSSSTSWYTKPAIIVGVIGAVLVVVFGLIFLRRK